MVNLKSVVDKGAEVCGSQANLARQLGVTPQRLDDWKRGRVPITPESAAKMGLLAGLDGEQVRMLAAQVIIDNPKNEGSREVLRRAFFGAILTGAVGILLLFGNTSNAYAAHADNFTVYTSCVYSAYKACIEAWRGCLVQAGASRALSRGARPSPPGNRPPAGQSLLDEAHFLQEPVPLRAGHGRMPGGDAGPGAGGSGFGLLASGSPEGTSAGL